MTGDRRLLTGVHAAVPEVGRAIANALHHTTGKRIRDLPIAIEKLL
jgi:CO/xanthine dehydrogenase Mo-binding subunit